MEKTTAEFEQQYGALTQKCGLIDFSQRTHIEVTGVDRATFLHNLCTNAVRDLPLGSGTEAFVLNVKGHIVGSVFIFACPNSHVLETVPNQAEKLLAHFDRYIIREDVQLHDRSGEWAELFLSGRNVESILVGFGLLPPKQRLSHVAVRLADCLIWLRRVDLAGPDGFLIACPREHLGEVRSALVVAGAVLCDWPAFEAARIEYGTPLFGHDFSDDNLPQEIDRNRQAICFTKGCYLGQETVARIDALGHVNRLLRGVKFPEGKVPTIGTELFAAVGDAGAQAAASCQEPDVLKLVGHVTSACWSPRLGAPLALAMVRSQSAIAGNKWSSPIGTAELVDLPLPPKK